MPEVFIIICQNSNLLGGSLMMRKRLVLSALIVCGLGGTVLAWRHFLSGSGSAALVSDANVPVKLSKVTLHTLPYQINEIGVIVAPEAVVLRAQQSGVIEKVLYQPGMRVKKGQILLEQESSQQRADLMSTQFHYQATQSQYARLQKLRSLSAGSVSQKDLESAQDDMQMALALVEQKKEALEQTILRAPCSGAIQLVGQDTSSTKANLISHWRAGAYLSSGESVVSVVGDDKTTVEYTVPVNMRDLIHLGQQVKVHAIDDKNKTAEGHVSYISPSTNVDNQTILVSVSLPINTPWQPGEKVAVTQIVDPTRKVIAIPGISVVTDLGGYAVYTVEKNKVVMKSITIGDRSATWVQVVRGLKKGDSIVVQGMQAIHPGSLVKVINV